MYADSASEWQRRAACRGPHAAAIFYPPARAERKDEKAGRERRAKTICRGCPVVDECLEFALRSREQHGIWGGMTEIERRLVVQARTA